MSLKRAVEGTVGPKSTGRAGGRLSLSYPFLFLIAGQGDIIFVESAEELAVMRLKAVLAAAVLGLAFGFAPGYAAMAADLDKPVAKKRVKYHKGHYGHYAYDIREDPYAYQYEPRGYYPYYRSDYWRPAGYIRYRNRLHYNVWNTRPPHYRFYRSWGYPLKYWPHYNWHARYHGRHRPWHW
jgi:hypothetical protein